MQREVTAPFFSPALYGLTLRSLDCRPETLEIGLAVRPAEREGGLKVLREKVEEPSPGQRRAEGKAGGTGRAMGWRRRWSRAENAPACPPLWQQGLKAGEELV